MSGTYFKACQLYRLRATKAMRIKGTRKLNYMEKNWVYINRKK